MTIKESEALEFRPKDNELFSPETADQQVQFIQKIMKAVMHEDVHYGKIPGCGDKPTLLKPGAEKLSMVFRLSPTFDIVKTNLERGHREYEITCLIKDINSERVQGEGVGMATSMESKWRYRKSERFCPACSAEAIIKNNFGQGDFKDGWMCWKKKDGCGEQFLKGDRAITDQIVQKVENDNPADQFNTVLKIAKKRAHVDAILTVLAASDCFAQDLEDMENKPTNENKTKGEDAGKNGKQPRQTSSGFTIHTQLRYGGSLPHPHINLIVLLKFAPA